MVKIAVSGGNSGVAREIIDALLATKKHKVLILSRQDAPAEGLAPGVSWAKTDYTDSDELAKTLKGVEVVLCFITVHLDPESAGQKTLIDASIKAGVKRYAPSEWIINRLDHMDWYAGKQIIRDYLKEINKDQKVIEYSLFQPGCILDYFTWPHQSMKYVPTVELFISYYGLQAVLLEGGDDSRMTLTSMDDISNVVVRAIDYEGEWPVNGGISGDVLTIGEIVKLGEKIRGSPFQIRRLKESDLKAGELKTDGGWTPTINHPSLTEEEKKTFSAVIIRSMLLAYGSGGMETGDDWNRLLPGYKFTKAAELLPAFWEGKPLKE